MKCFLSAIILLLFFGAPAQQVSGLYSGTLFNDTTRMRQHYELALSEYRGKITGYSYTTFVVNDTFYYGIRRVKATKTNGELTVEDGQMLVNNFPESPAKGVHRITTIPLNGEDSLQEIKGRWKTTQTKHYYSVPGSVEMRRDNDSSRSALITHLKELQIISSGPAQTATAKKEKGPKEQKVNTEKKESSAAITTTPPYNQRQQNTIQTISVQNDSLVLSFYDNGVVDGDSISVYLNGQNIISATKLTGLATKKTIYLNNLNSDTVELVLVAENLGSLPPNTGLLLVQDGANRHEVRFSADLQTNAAIVFRKTKQ